MAIALMTSQFDGGPTRLAAIVASQLTGTPSQLAKDLDLSAGVLHSPVSPTGPAAMSGRTPNHV
jgi:hypothetical protein